MSDEDSNADVNLQRPIVNIANVVNSDGTQSKFSDMLTALSTGTLLDGSVTNAKLSSTAVTESVTVPGTFTNTSLSPTAGILPTQLAAGVVKVLSGTVAYTDVTKTVFQIPATAAILDVYAVCTEQFDGKSAAVKLGVTGTLSGFIPTVTLSLNAVSGQDCSTRGTLLWNSVNSSPIKPIYAADTNLVATVSGTIGTIGALTVYCVYESLA